MIKELNLSNFRGHTARYQFGAGRNTIKGCNEAGKSTIKEAIAFAWLGTDAEGTKNPDHLITVGSEVSEVHLTTPRTIIKRKKKRGSTSEIRLSMPDIPDIKLTQTDLMAKLQLSPEVFMSCWNVGYFMKLSSEARLKVLGEVAKLDRKLLIQQLLPKGTELPIQVKLVNPRIDAKAVADIRRQLQNKLQSLQGAVQQIDSQVATMEQATSIDHASYSQNLADMDAQLSDWDLYDKLLAKYKADIARLESSVALGNQLAKSVDEAVLFLQQTELEGKELAAQIKIWESEDKSMREKMDKARAGIKTVTLTVPKKRTSASAGDCPTCGQVVGAEYLKTVDDAYKKLVEEYNKHERQVADHNKPLLAEMDELQRAHAKVLADWNKGTAKSDQMKKEYVRVKGQLAQLEAELKKAKPAAAEKPVAPQAPKNDRAALSKNRDQIKAAIHSYMMASTQKNSLLEQRGTHMKDAEKLAYQVKIHGAIEEALNKLPELETQQTLDCVLIPGISMTLVDGDLVVCNERGVDYRSLSDGRRMKIDIQLCTTLQNAAGPTAPRMLFVDNADLMDAHVSVPDGVQVLIAEVDQEKKEVEVIQWAI